MKILLYPHGGSGNHGCEAIVRSTSIILNQENLILFSSSAQQDERYGLSECCDVHSMESPITKSMKRMIAAIKYRLFSDKMAYDRLYFRNIIKEALTADIALSIGGDNYCYGVPSHIMLINHEIRKIGLPTVLWGCSIEPEAIKDEVLDDLQGYNLIISRESLTTSALRNKGLTNVVQAPDPAFLLPVSKVELPQWWKMGDTIGINASPMILDCSPHSLLTLQNYEELIKYLLTKTDSEIALIPHVIWSHNDDRIPLTYLYNKFEKSGRIHIVDMDYNAQQLKYLISNCRAVITARTHASIAAYSTLVPTIVLGYSVKARGIALDLFGREDAYVLSVQNLKDKKQLLNLYIDLIHNEKDIRVVLSKQIPIYKDITMKMSDYIKALL